MCVELREEGAYWILNTLRPKDDENSIAEKGRVYIIGKPVFS